MKISFPLVIFATGTVAQGVGFLSPPQGAVLHPGQYFTAQIVQYNQPVSLIDVGIALGMGECPHGNCPSPCDGMSNVLYAGPYNPQVDDPGGWYQNFTVQVPQHISHGLATLGVVRFSLIGIENGPTIGCYNTTVKVARKSGN
ncbi:hypothetical protein GGI43DRAFT_302900 [Trichoderma evansii]